MYPQLKEQYENRLFDLEDFLKGKVLREPYRDKLVQSLGIKSQDMQLWEDIVKKMTVIFHQDGIIWSQFQGYENLRVINGMTLLYNLNFLLFIQELDFDAYRKKYGNIERMDRILKVPKEQATNKISN